MKNNRRINELLRFTLPSVDYTKGYQAKPRPELTGGSAPVSPEEAYRLKAVNELLRWTIASDMSSKKESKKKVTLYQWFNLICLIGDIRITFLTYP